jgi:hypothetical protein
MKKIAVGLLTLGSVLFAQPTMEFSLSYVGMSMD